ALHPRLGLRVGAPAPGRCRAGDHPRRRHDPARGPHPPRLPPPPLTLPTPPPHTSHPSPLVAPPAPLAPVAPPAPLPSTHVWSRGSAYRRPPRDHMCVLA